MADEKLGADQEEALAKKWKCLIRPFGEPFLGKDSLDLAAPDSSQKMVSQLLAVLPRAIIELSPADISQYVMMIDDLVASIQEYNKYLHHFAEQEKKMATLLAISFFLKGFSAALFALQDHVEMHYGIIPFTVQPILENFTGNQLGVVQKNWPFQQSK